MRFAVTGNDIILDCSERCDCAQTALELANAIRRRAKEHGINLNWAVSSLLEESLADGRQSLEHAVSHDYMISVAPPRPNGDEWGLLDILRIRGMPFRSGQANASLQ